MVQYHHALQIKKSIKMNTKFLSNIANKQVYDKLVDIIKKWTNNKTWIYGIENPFLERSAYSHPSPVVSDELYFVIEIKERTTFVDGKLDEYVRTETFQTAALSDPNLNPDGDIQRLLAFLDSLDVAARGEREQQITGYSNAGKKIETSNPFLWKL